MPFHVGPLALTAMQTLTQLLDAGDTAGVEKWIATHSKHSRRREQQIHVGLAHWIGHRMRLADPAKFYSLDIDAEASEASRMCGRMVTAAMNDDDATLQALVSVALGWPSPARAELLSELIHLAS